MCHSCGQAWRNYNRYRQLLYTGFARFESIVNHILYYAGAHLATLQRHLKNCWHWKMCIHIIIYEWHHCERMANWRFVRVNVLCSALFADRSIVYVFGILYIFSIFVASVFRMGFLFLLPFYLCVWFSFLVRGYINFLNFAMWSSFVISRILKRQFHSWNLPNELNGMNGNDTNQFQPLQILNN